MQIPNPALLRRPTLRREAQSTSALEGTYAPLTDVFGAENSAEAKTPELREILNYVAAAEYAYQWVGERSRITRGLICDLHAILMRGSEADAERAGEIRDIQVVIGSGGRIQRPASSHRRPATSWRPASPIFIFRCNRVLQILER